MLTRTIPSYLYKEYEDDDDLQALVSAYNAMSQEYVDWFNEVGLPIYTGEGSLVEGDLLDWVDTNLYGLVRPVLPFGETVVQGVLNSYTPNFIVLNGQRITPPQDVFATTDDVYRRILTWMFFKGDGKQFTIRWLKRRVQRFLTMPNGTGLGISETYRISVTFGANKDVYINLRNSILTLGIGALNTFALNTRPLNTIEFSIEPLVAFPLGPVFKAAVDSGVLELPFSFVWHVNII